MARGMRFERADPFEGALDAQAEQRERFRERIALGRYDDLFETPVRNVLREGAAIRGVDEELGAIRFALAKLLAEELDASKLAAGVARLTSAAVQAMRLGRTLGDSTDDELAALVDQLLAEVGPVQRTEQTSAGIDPA